MARRVLKPTDVSHPPENDSAISLRELATRHRVDAAERRLSAAKTYTQVIDAIDEILVHLVGVARLAIIERQKGGPRVVHSRKASAPWTDTSGARGEAGLTATVPLILAGRLLATVVVFGFRGTKRRLDVDDRLILHVIARSGALAMQRARVESERPTLRVPKVG
ncbi:MAG TPA: hypothetical protein VMI75_02970 [Polyangiaceae bacterium]|nr:hypothetical protein [Polyangiaceae bacterium]